MSSHAPFRNADDEREAQPWLHAIRRAPFDDAGPSRGYGAWLRERGYPRGEHLELACERSRYKHPARFADLAVKMAALEPSANTWFDALRALGATELLIRRGVVVRARLVGAAVAHVGELLRKEPLRELVLVCTDRAAATRAAACEDLATLPALTLSDGDPAAEAALLRSPHLRALETIVVDAATDDTVAALGAMTVSPRRVELAQLDSAGLQALAAGPLFSATEALALPRGRFGDRDGVALGGAPLPQLRRLDLRDTPIGAETLAAIAGRLHRLDALDLGGTAIGSVAIDLVLRSVGSSLFSLGVARTRDGAAITKLLRSPLMRQLTALDLRGAAYSRLDLWRMLHRSKIQRTRLLPILPWESDTAIARAYPALLLGS